MKLTSRSEYALLALIYLARNDSADYITAETVATAQGIPSRFLEQILLALKRAGYVLSSKGQHGGFRLAKSADEISLAEIIRLFDGALAPTESVSEYFYESTPIEREDKLVGVFKGIRDHVAKKLEETTVGDMV
ncbi:MAG: Rrf2 family transcriptional regulator [Deltaproteobacteria bacterium]|nr:Rrf2 family transcriptional regulator [Deltaproteobacteria bacterium]